MLSGLPDGLIASYVAGLVVVGFAAWNERLLHWFVVPLIACGILTGTLAVAWFRNRLATFDALGLFGIFGFHYFFLSPLLQVQLDRWMRAPDVPLDWRPWLGRMAILNALGLGALLFGAWMVRRAGSSVVRTNWRIDFDRLRLASYAALVGSLVLQLVVLARTGGISGYVNSYLAGRTGESHVFQGMGLVFAVSESFPLLMVAVLALRREPGRGRLGLVPVLALLALFVLLQLFVFGGLRGSRSNTVLALVWALAIVHLRLRPIPKRALVIAGLLGLLFVYVYGFYKAGGPDAVRELIDPDNRAAITERSDRGLDRVLVGDLARADVQALVLYRLVNQQWEYEPANGRTYLASLALIVPRALWADRPEGKVKYGTDLQYGPEAYETLSYRSTRIYGLAGEFMLNFGYWLVPLPFALAGALFGLVRVLGTRLLPDDPRLILLPVGLLAAVLLVANDSDNLIVYLFKNAAVPVAVVIASSRRVALPQAHTAGAPSNADKALGASISPQSGGL